MGLVSHMCSLHGRAEAPPAPCRTAGRPAQPAFPAPPGLCAPRHHVERALRCATLCPLCCAALPQGRGWAFMFWNFHRFSRQPTLAALVSGEARGALSARAACIIFS